MKQLMAIVFMLTGTSMANWAYADALWLCRDLPPSALVAQAAAVRSHVYGIDGGLALLQAGPRPATSRDCDSKPLPDEAKPLWVGFLPQGSQPARQVTLQGNDRGQGFMVSEVSVETTGSESPPTAARVMPDGTTDSRHAAAPARAAWFWSPAAWLDTPEMIFQQAAAHRLGRVYITVMLRDGAVAHAEALGDFIVAARAHGLAVWAVLGDPAAVLPEQQLVLAGLAASLAEYNRAAEAGRQLEGLQLDVEPYLLPGYQLQPAAWQQRYVETVQRVHMAAPDLPLDLAMPYWWGDPQHGGSDLFDRLQPSIQSITVMDYRTDFDDIVRFAQPFLDWGERAGRRIAIAVERMPIDDEERRVYMPDNQGELWQTQLAGHTVLVLFDRPVVVADGHVFRFSRSARFRGHTVSFSGHADRLSTLLPKLEQVFAHWPSFAGMALHGL